MSDVKRGLDILSDKEREKYIKEIISYFWDERHEEIGVIAAGELLDFFLHSVGPGIYNKALEDAKKVIRSEFEKIDFEIDLLKRQ